jgi:hypothetical protein
MSNMRIEEENLEEKTDHIRWIKVMMEIGSQDPDQILKEEVAIEEV